MASVAKGATTPRRPSITQIKKSVTNMMVKVPSISMAKGPLPSMRKTATIPLEKEVALDDNWEVGGKYQVLRDGVDVWNTPDLDDEVVNELSRGDTVILVYLIEPSDEGPDVPVGLVLPPNGAAYGWVALEDASDGSSGPPIRRSKLPNSWSMKARYAAQNEATVRRERQLSSEWVGELHVGEEVLALDIGINDNDDGHKARLRMMISTDSGLVGWISPETWRGDLLLAPVNLLSTKVVEMHNSPQNGRRRRLSFTRRVQIKAPESPIAKSRSPSVGPRRSYRPGGLLPWEPGGQYRVLETIALRQGSSIYSREVGRLPAGCLVTVESLDIGDAQFPVARVTVSSDGLEDGSKGWIRCVAKDGHDVIDTRDQLQFEKVKAKLEAERREAEAARREAERRERETEEELRLLSLQHEEAVGATAGRRPAPGRPGRDAKAAGDGPQQRPEDAPAEKLAKKMAWVLCSRMMPCLPCSK